jgi:UDP-N-acetylglucosamine 2-epimerase (non-hydrolysing)
MSHKIHSTITNDNLGQRIHVFIGTKAQYIKTAPLLRLMQKRNISYNLIDSGQHASFSSELRKELDVKKPDIFLKSKGNIKTVPEVVAWFIRYMLFALFCLKSLRRDIFRNSKGICIIHGDTPSTLLALVLAKRAGLKVAHIEAGLRSYNLFRPFPEELVRRICMRFSDYLFAPSNWAYRNLKRMRIKGKTYNIGQNTNVEAVYYSLSKKANTPNIESEYCLMTIHRVETILDKKRLYFVVELAERIAQGTSIFFVLHDPTRLKLQKYRLLRRIAEHPNITSSGLIEHSAFLKLLSKAKFVVTDGGSIQEESYYLDVPCLLMRTETERREGIGTNVKLSNFNQEKVENFLRSFRRLKRGKTVEPRHPSSMILDIIQSQRN